MATMPKPVPPTKRVEHFADHRDEMIVTTLSKGKREEVEFFSKRDIRVAFDFEEGSPFHHGHEFLVKAGHVTSSGPLHEKVEVGEKYRYRIHDLKGQGQVVDPTIIIQE
jgi:hypothetical protein